MSSSNALDESAERPRILEFIEILARLPNTHLLITSRREKDLEEVLEEAVQGQLDIKNDSVAGDMQLHIRSRLKRERKLAKLSHQVKMEIEKRLSEGAHGMFRWVTCQLDALTKCLTINDIRKTLMSLPKDLDSTYERILESIDEDQRDRAIRLLQCLCFAVQPMTAAEIVDVLAVTFGEPSVFDKEDRLSDPDDMLLICPSLITITKQGDTVNVNGHNLNDEKDSEIENSDAIEDDRSDGKDSVIEVIDENGDDSDERSDQEDSVVEHRKNSSNIDSSRGALVSLSHFSVKEYLVSDRTRNGASHFKSISPASAHDDLARTCLVYLLHMFALVSPNQKKNEDYYEDDHGDYYEDYPLANYAMRSWQEHMKEANAQHVHHESPPLALRLIAPQSEYSSWWFREYCARIKGGYFPLLVASNHGLTILGEALLNNRTENNEDSTWLGTALYVAAHSGRMEMVELLLANGADINACRGFHGQAIQVAAYRGHDGIVEMLLAKGADVNAHGGYHGQALKAAAANGHNKIIEILLAKGANVNSRGGYYGQALQAAAAIGFDNIIEVLLAKGADINARGGRYGQALQAAAHNGHNKTIEILLAKGADVNARGGRYKSALGAAVKLGSERAVKQLLDNGADVNLWRDEPRKLPLILAIESGVKGMVELLLQHGATKITNAMEYASRNGETGISKVLLNHVVVDRKILLGAVREGFLLAAQLLLDNGADAGVLDHEVLIKPGVIGLTPLHHVLKNGSGSSSRGSRNLSAVLAFARNYGLHVDIDACDTQGWTPLHWAAYCQDFEATRELLAAGANRHVKDWQGWTPHDLAIFVGRSDLAEELSIADSGSGGQVESVVKGSVVIGLCDSCHQVLRSSQYHCIICEDFDLCFRCIRDVAMLHPQHAFRDDFRYPLGGEG